MPLPAPPPGRRPSKRLNTHHRDGPYCAITVQYSTVCAVDRMVQDDSTAYRFQSAWSSHARACAAVRPLDAQTAAGEITGIVKDQAGAAVPGATITVTETRTNLSASGGVHARRCLHRREPGARRIPPRCRARGLQTRAPRGRSSRRPAKKRASISISVSETFENR